MSLYYLSKIHDVNDLNEKTSKYIFHHQKDNTLQILLLDNNDNNIDEQKTQYEEAISQNLAAYIELEQFTSLPLHVLHRILSRAKNIDQEKIENFLIACLTKIGTSASVLFDVIDMEKASSRFIKKLLDDFSDKFDFHFINPLFLKSVYIQQNEIIKQSEIMKMKQEEKLQQISEANRLMSEKVDLMQNEIESLKRLVIQKVDEINQIKNLQPFLFINYGGNENQAFFGIIHYLSHLCGGNVHEKGIVNVKPSSYYDNFFLNTEKFVVDFNEKERHFASKSSDKEWVSFDFIGRKVKPTHYSIRSRQLYDCNHPKSWAIEGSNTANEDD